MDKLYFEVTDMVEYALSDQRVTGVQRVQARMIGAMRREQGPRVQALFVHPRTKRPVSFDPLGVLDQDEFDASRLLAQLGLTPTGRLPPKAQIKRYLRPYDNNKLLRAWKKALLHVRAIVHPSSLAGMGFETKRTTEDVERVPMNQDISLGLSDVLTFMGCNWNLCEPIELARKHRRSGGQVVQMIHDLIPIVVPQYFEGGHGDRFERFLVDSLDFASRYLCVSECTRRDLLRFLEREGVTRRADVVPLAHEYAGVERGQRVPLTEVLPTDRLTAEPFVLFVGTIERRKNVLGLLKAWRVLLDSMPGQVPLLVFAGKPGWGSESFFDALSADPQLAQRVVVVRSPSDQSLGALYGACMFTAYPSFYEGWGLPVGESLWFGKVCVTMPTSSLPEVGGPWAEYAESEDTAALAATCRALITDPARLAARERQIADAPLRTWRDAARSMYDALVQQPS